MAKPHKNAKKTVKSGTPPAKPVAANDDLWKNLPLQSVPQKAKKTRKAAPKPEQKEIVKPAPEPIIEAVATESTDIPQRMTRRMSRIINLKPLPSGNGVKIPETAGAGNQY